MELKNLRDRFATSAFETSMPRWARTRRLLGISALLVAGLCLWAGPSFASSFPSSFLDESAVEAERPSPSQADANPQGVEDLLAEGIETRGTVIDAVTGQPIRGVRMVATTGFFDSSLPSFRRIETARQTIDGAFRYDCVSCTDVKLRFFAEGYRSEVVHLGGLNEEFQGQELTHSILNVLLEPTADPVILKRFRGRLVVDADPRKSRVLMFDGDTAQHASWFELSAKAENSETPLQYLRLLTTLDASGQPKVRDDQEARYFKTVEAADIDFSSFDGGVAVFELGDVSPRSIRRSMILAPADGYQPLLELDATSTESVYFYVRMGEFYGRGVARPPVLEQTSTGQRLVATVELYLNPDGTRNLETLE